MPNPLDVVVWISLTVLKVNARVEILT